MISYDNTESNDNMIHSDLTSQIIGCAQRVYKTIGRGFLERVYENALAIELREAGLDVRVCGDTVISSLMGGSADVYPFRYHHASPAQMPPIDAAIYLNPAGMMLSLGDPEVMTRRARTTGERVTLRPVTESDHFQLITPSEETWTVVLETIQASLGLE